MEGTFLGENVENLREKTHLEEHVVYSNMARCKRPRFKYKMSLWKVNKSILIYYKKLYIRHIYHGNKKCDNCGTFLQLDMNAGKNLDCS